MVHHGVQLMGKGDDAVWKPYNAMEHYLLVVRGDAIKHCSHKLIRVLIKQKHWTPKEDKRDKNMTKETDKSTLSQSVSAITFDE